MTRFRLLGPLARYTGYAVGFRGLVTQLAKRPDLDFQLRATKSLIPPETEQHILDLIARNGDYDRMGVAVGFPDILDSICSRYSVSYTMYEADDIPDSWKRHVERSNEVWVPSRFCAEVFGKYNRHIRVVPWGIDAAQFHPRKRIRNGHRYVFGAVGRQGPRKGTDILIRAFEMAFRDRDDVRLVIKTRDMSASKMPSITSSNIEVIDEDWGDERLAEFYCELDCLVEPSRGEGCGMPPIQAVLSKTPAIVTNWSGLADYIDGNGVWGIRIKGLSKCGRGMMASHARWAEPDERHLAELMEWAVDTRPSVNGDYSKWTLDNMTKEFVGCLHSAWGRAGR